MYMRYNLYRSKYPDQIFNSEMIECPLEKDEHLVIIDKIMRDCLTLHIQNLPEIKHYGVAYIGRMEIVNIEITDKDNITLTEEQFRAYMAQPEVMPLLQIVWSKSNKTETN